MNDPRERGCRAEARALAFLTGHGLELVARNFRCRRGEIDLIMLAGDTLVFVEVRMRSRRSFGSAAESVTLKKQRRIVHASTYFLQQRSRWRNHACRFDVVAIDGSQPNAIEWLRDAFRIDS